MAFDLDVEAEEFEEDVEGVLEVHFLVSYDLVVAVGKERLQAACEGFGLPALYLADEVADGEYAGGGGAGEVVGHKELDEACFDLSVREAECVDVEDFVVVLDGEVSALVDEGQRVLVHHVDAVEYVRGDFLLRDVFEVVAGLLQLADEQRGCAGLEPVVAELFLAECGEQAEGVVYAFAFGVEVVAVVIRPQAIVARFFGYSVCLCQFLHAAVEVSVQFGLGDAAYVRVAQVQ